jgi:uncharacterized membrane-anchored protein YhcB (DUF1043 family)
MDQFSNNDSSGMVGFLVGIIVLVFAGIFFSLLADKRFSFSSNRISLQDTIRDEKAELDSVKAQLDTARDHWRKHCEPLSSQGKSADGIAASIRAGEARLKNLRIEKDAAAAELATARADFDEYRNLYRQQVRGAAAEEQMDELKSRTGRTYKNVVILKVSAAGIEIRHDRGISRLLPDELDPSWHERFQWNRDEVAKTLEEEKARQDRHNRFVDQKNAPPPEPPKKPRKSSKKAKKGPVEDPRVQVLRDDVREARSRYLSAQSDASRARGEAAMNRGRSVPGSLETWSERAARLEAAAVKLRSQYVSARGKLAAVAPRDAILIDEEP